MITGNEPQIGPGPVGPVAKTSARPGTRISCHAALDEAARAPFSKERRMRFAKATKFHRKSGQGLGNRSNTIRAPKAWHRTDRLLSLRSQKGIWRFWIRPFMLAGFAMARLVFNRSPS